MADTSGLQARQRVNGLLPVLQTYIAQRRSALRRLKRDGPSVEEVTAYAMGSHVHIKPDEGLQR